MHGIEIIIYFQKLNIHLGPWNPKISFLQGRIYFWKKIVHRLQLNDVFLYIDDRFRFPYIFLRHIFQLLPTRGYYSESILNDQA